MDTLVLNTDVNARRSDYSHLTGVQVAVTSIFPTIQGEGPFAGWPAIFIRLAGCNLGAKHSCPWCDTYFQLSTSAAKNIAALVEQVRQLSDDHRYTLIVLTGGEPLLQPNTPKLVMALLAAGWKVQIETNGYFTPADLLLTRPNLHLVISPKVNQRRIYPALDRHLMLASACLKVLVDADPDSPYHQPPDYAARYQELTGNPVYISPINHYRRPLEPGE